MVKVTIIDTDADMTITEESKCVLSFLMDDECARVFLVGTESPTDIVEKVSKCLGELLYRIAKQAGTSNEVESYLILKHLFLKSMFESKENAPEGQEQ